MSDAPAVLETLIVDPNKTIYEGKVVKMFVPGRLQDLAILPNHTPLYTELIEGTIAIEEAGGKKVEQKIDGGVLRVENNTVKILVGF
jgi:F-type H+-transporting ATPase subunit epsilon